MFQGASYDVAFLILVAGLLMIAVARWARTPAAHPERQARADMARLLLAVLAAQGGVLARANFRAGSPAFWLCTGLLLPFAVAALFFIGRLLRFYRRAHPS